MRSHEVGQSHSRVGVGPARLPGDLHSCGCGQVEGDGDLQYRRKCHRPGQDGAHTKENVQPCGQELSKKSLADGGPKPSKQQVSPATQPCLHVLSPACLQFCFLSSLSLSVPLRSLDPSLTLLASFSVAASPAQLRCFQHTASLRSKLLKLMENLQMVLCMSGGGRSRVLTCLPQLGLT